MVSWKECCLNKQYGGLGLGDPNATKTNLLYKWIVKTMELGDSNLQCIFMYMLARLNPKRERIWRVSLDWFTIKQHQCYYRSMGWGHVSKVWKVILKNVYQLPPCTLMELLNYEI